MKKKVKRKVFFIALMLVIIFTILITPISKCDEADGGKSPMMTYVNNMNPGWNLGNTFEATGDETSWGNPPTTEELIKAIAAQGYKSIRIPITWKHRMGDAPDYLIKPEFMLRIQEVVDWSLDAGLYVMINLHHDSGSWIMKMEEEHDEVLNRFNSVWKQISAHFRDYPDKLMFESVNEPRFSDDWSKDAPEYFQMLDELNTSFHKIVRNSGGNNATRPLVLPTITCNASQERLDELYKTIIKLNDENIIATVHYYGYYPFSVNTAGETVFGDVARNDMESTFARVYDTFTARGIAAIMGEYGILGFDKDISTIQRGEMLKFFEHILYCSNKYKLPLMLWDNGRHFDRRSLVWRDPEFYELMMTGLKERSSYTEQNYIYIKKDAAINDKKLKLILNGNALIRIKNGDAELKKGVDYDIEGDLLVFKSDLLKEIIKGEYGVNSTLICEFSKGVDWNIDVIYYDTPELKRAAGIITGFSIPVAFNGDSLSAMEAFYKNGLNAGPDSWTSFLEFNRYFKPLYSYSQIHIAREFFDNARDGEILLKVHFLSGETVEYVINKNGAGVTGNPVDEPKPADKPKTETAVPAAEDGHTDEQPQKQSETDVGKTSMDQPEDNTDMGGGKSILPIIITGVIILIAAGIGIYLRFRILN